MASLPAYVPPHRSVSIVSAHPSELLIQLHAANPVSFHKNKDNPSLCVVERKTARDKLKEDQTGPSVMQILL